MNEQQAFEGERTLREYAENARQALSSDPLRAEWVPGLLASVMQLCEREGWSFADALSAAAEHRDGELSE